MKTYLTAYFNSLKKTATKLACGLALLSAAGSCGVTQMDLKLAQQTFHYDVSLGVPAFISAVPNISCQNTTTCTNTLKSFGIIDPRLVPSCDTSTSSCVANVKIGIVYPVDVSQDPAFTTGFAQGQADNIRDIKLTYGITSGVNIDIDTIDVYLGPKGASSPTGAGVNFLGTVGPIPKLATIPDGDNFLLIPDGTPAHDQYVDYCAFGALFDEMARA